MNNPALVLSATDLARASQALVQMPFSATPTFDLSQGVQFAMTLTGNVTSSTFSNLRVCPLITFKIQQGGTGAFTFAWPSNVKGGMTIGSAAGGTSVQTFMCDGTNLFALGQGVINQ